MRLVAARLQPVYETLLDCLQQAQLTAWWGPDPSPHRLKSIQGFFGGDLVGRTRPRGRLKGRRDPSMRAAREHRRVFRVIAADELRQALSTLPRAPSVPVARARVEAVISRLNQMFPAHLDPGRSRELGSHFWTMHGPALAQHKLRARGLATAIVGDLCGDEDPARTIRRDRSILPGGLRPRNAS